MNCDKAQEYVLDYIDHELPYCLQEDLEQHLGTCQGCRKICEEHKNTTLLLRLRSVPAPDESYWDDVWEKVRDGLPAKAVPFSDEHLQPASRGAELISLLTQRKPRFIAAAIFVVAILSGLFLEFSRTDMDVLENDDIEFVYISEEGWPIDKPDFGPIPATFQPEVEFSVYSRAALGGIDPISKSSVIWKVEAIKK